MILSDFTMLIPACGWVVSDSDIRNGGSYTELRRVAFDPGDGRSLGTETAIEHFYVAWEGMKWRGAGETTHAFASHADAAAWVNELAARCDTERVQRSARRAAISAGVPHQVVELCDDLHHIEQVTEAMFREPGATDQDWHDRFQTIGASYHRTAERIKAATGVDPRPAA